MLHATCSTEVVVVVYLLNGIFFLQWLVKKAIERKEEMGDYIREFSVSQFNKTHSTPQVCTQYTVHVMLSDCGMPS